MFNRIKALFQKWQLKWARRSLEHLLKVKDPELYKILWEVADTMARDMVCQWLDNKGINHCSLCPNTTPLLAMRGSYFCQAHFDAIRVKEEAQSNGLVVPNGIAH